MAPVFPHDLPKRSEKYGSGTSLITKTPFFDEIVVELAIAAIEGESLGLRGTTDMLAISFSSTDAIGHDHGPTSVELQDTYLRLDQYIARLLEYLDDKFGKSNILLFLTSDHGVSYSSSYLKDKGIPAGYFDLSLHMDSLGRLLNYKHGENYLL